MKLVRKVVDAVLRWFGYSRSAPMWEAFKRVHAHARRDEVVFRRKNGAEVTAIELLLAHSLDRELWTEWLHSVEDQVILSIQGEHKRAISLDLLLKALDESGPDAMNAWREHPATRDVMIAQRVATLKEENIAARVKLDELRAQKDSAYLERNRLVAALAQCFPSGIRATAIEGWDPEWHGCVFIDLPSGQASWHYHTSHAFLFEGLPPYEKPWDGHSTEEKYARLRALNREHFADHFEVQGPHPEWILAAGDLGPVGRGIRGVDLRIRPNTRILQIAFAWRALTAFMLDQSLAPGASEVFANAARAFDLAAGASPEFDVRMNLPRGSA